MDPRDDCLKRQLLFASVQAYHPDESSRPGGVARFLEAPRRTSLRSGRPFDFALIGRFREGIVVAFRGTLPPADLSADSKRIGRPELLNAAVIADWRNNLHFPIVRGAAVGQSEAVRAVLPGAVHRGFAESLASLWDEVAGHIGALAGAEASPRLYFTGHSKGGALANLAAVCAPQIWPGAIVRAVTFGAPRAGDADFADGFRAARIDCRRYEVAEDLVPDVPPGGVPVGTLYAVPVKSYALQLGLVWQLGAMFSRDDRVLIPEPVAAHLPYRSFGYGDNVCEPGCRHDWQ